ncbi:putative IQ motif, EF-hand binding, calponin domain, armadillo-like helical, CH domain superfamily [Helianthus annuus]|nr:putative IQ motif, EF-hand binding, calponin domain, armadillo-like helical, CH domain superfamily [Helianthus annuus]
MEPKQPKQQIPSSPLPNPPSSLLRDISNFKTPKPQRRLQTNPSSKFESPCPQFFTASKQTPKSSYSTVRPRPRYSLAAQKLKAVALEQSKSSRKTQTNKEKSLKSLAKSLTVWLNFLFENPRLSCGVEVSRFTGEEASDVSSDGVFLGAKRDSVSHGGVDIDREWRGPKRRKDILWVDKGKKGNKFSGSMYSHLKVSLGDVCSLDDLKERMAVYLSQSNCHEILDAMTHVTKNIDEGRLKMKAHCPIVTDVGMKENALKILMSYNPVWLRIGLYIIFGGESLLPNPNIDTSSEKELSFLKTVSEKLFFSHSGLAKAYIYNKLVDGLYRPGYYEKLGNVILKRILLLVLILDRAKSQSSLPICYGIDGLDGGSPLLFTAQATISSSSEVISDFLSPEVMHGVGNLLTQLMIMGYKVSYQQNPLVKYVFKVTNLFNDLQDGVLLCRVIQLLRHDPSILKKVVVPSDDRKKNLVNCEISLNYLKQIGVPLIDEDGTEIITEDIVNGDKELIISLLWNMFVHLQLPLLINNELISDEIININGPEVTLPNASSHLDMLLEWIKAICDNYDLKVESFTSLVDGKAMWCLLDYYFKKEHCDASSNMDPKETNGASIMSASDYVDAVHNFLLSQKLTTLLGNFPEVLQVSDILECKGACSDRGVIILLVFLSSQLVVKRNLRQINFHKLLGHNQNPEIKCIKRDQLIGCHKHEVETYQNENEDNGRNFKAIMAWWKEMAQHNCKANVNPVYTAFLGKQSSDKQREIAATIIQSHFRRLVKYRNYTRIKNAVSSLQAVIRVWVMVKNTSATTKFNTIENQEQSCDGRKLSRSFSRYLIDRHAFIKVKRCVVIIQRATRHWIVQKHQTDAAIMIQKCIRGHAARSAYIRQSTATIIQACYRSWILRKSFLNQKQAATKIQNHYRRHISRKRFLNKKQAATKIQRYYCGLVIRKNFINQKQAAIKLQSYYRGFLVRKSYLSQKQAATKIQSYCRGLLSRNGFLKKKQAVMKLQRLHRSVKCLRNFKQSKLEIKAVITIQCHTRRWIARRVACRCKRSIVLIQRFCRGWLTRRGFLLQKEAATRIQSALRSLKCVKEFNSHKNAAIVIQRFVKGWIVRKRLLESDAISGCNHDHTKDGYDGHEFKLYECSTLKLQRWWRGILLTQSQKRSRSAVLIQSNVRGWIARKKAAQSKHRIAVIQSYWKGYIERKHSRGKVADIRLRVQKAAANVDDGMRIINRLIAALSDLKNMKSVSGILHTCATIDMATKYSQKCCEKLVDAGAIDTLLELIRSISRSIVDQEVLRHTLSIFRNLTRYPHLTEALIDTNGSCQIILWEFIRNKEDSYFVAADVLRKICSNKKGVERLRGLMALVKRLNNLVEDLKRKACNEKRNQRTAATKEPMDRRLKEAIQILKLITNG